jgi:hypothetical protein
VAKARASDSNAGKSRAARDLLANAPWYLALWAVAGLLLLQFGRRSVRARRFLPVAALLWSLVGWFTQVHVEWLSDRTAQTATLLRWGVRFPDFFQFAVAAAVLLLMIGIVFVPRQAARRVYQTPSSRMGYAGFVLFVGLGWWMLLDLSATGHASNRFHALYQQVYVFAAFALLTMLAPVRLQLADGIGRRLGSLLLLTRAHGASLKRWLLWLGAGAVAVLFVAACCREQAADPDSHPKCSGSGWWWVSPGCSSCAVKPPWRCPSRGGAFRGMVLLWPLFFVLSVPLAGLVLTDDFGPLFVMLYAASILRRHRVRLRLLRPGRLPPLAGRRRRRGDCRRLGVSADLRALFGAGAAGARRRAAGQRARAVQRHQRPASDHHLVPGIGA